MCKRYFVIFIAGAIVAFILLLAIMFTASHVNANRPLFGSNDNPDPITFRPKWVANAALYSIIVSFVCVFVLGLAGDMIRGQL